MPKVACSKCDRTGRLRVSQLIKGHGAELHLPVLKLILAGDYQRLNPRSIYDRLRGHS